MRFQNNSILNKIASILAFVIGAMAVVAGGRVLLGILPDYYVINWLPVYNFVMGVVSIFFSSIIIWKNNKFAIPAAIGTFGLHTAVMLILQAAYRGVVAPDSIMAMTVRLVVWAIIIGLLIVQRQKRQ
ncbi:MAG: hypothetical protein JW963_01010 [Anaerolineales bacterium]|nr:hypothetical protein [Anaerolineales bacterium]